MSNAVKKVHKIRMENSPFVIGRMLARRVLVECLAKPGCHGLRGEWEVRSGAE